MTVLDIEIAPLERKEHDLSVEPPDQKVRGVGREAMIVLDVEIWSSPPGFSHRKPDQTRMRVDGLGAEDFIERERLRLQKHSRIRRQDNVTL